MNHMPFIISEEIIIQGVKLGYDRQVVHERLKIILVNYKFSNISINENRNENESIDENIFDIFKGDEIINSIIENTNISLDPKNYIGRCEEQIFKFYT
jgi:adenylosuccinate lyase